MVWFVAGVVVPWLKPLKLYVQLPEVSDPAVQGLVVEVQVAPDRVTVPLLQLAVAVPAKPVVWFVAGVVVPWLKPLNA